MGIVFFFFLKFLINSHFGIKIVLFKNREPKFDLKKEATKYIDKESLDDFKQIFFISFIDFNKNSNVEETTKEIILKYAQKLLLEDEKSIIIFNLLIVYYIMISLLFLSGLIYFNSKIYSVNEEYGSVIYILCILLYMITMLYSSINIFLNRRKIKTFLKSEDEINNIEFLIKKRDLFNEFKVEDTGHEVIKNIIDSSVKIGENKTFLILGNIIIYFIGFILFEIVFEVIFNAGVIIKG